VIFCSRLPSPCILLMIGMHRPGLSIGRGCCVMCQSAIYALVLPATGTRASRDACSTEGR
jgi:hypothetical protein